MTKVQAKNIKSIGHYESIVVTVLDMTIAEAMDPENWPEPPRATSTQKLSVGTFVTIFASDGAAQTYVASLDYLGRPELAYFRTEPPIPSMKRARDTRLTLSTE
jgi:hypothetical protein